MLAVTANSQTTQGKCTNGPKHTYWELPHMQQRKIKTAIIYMTNPANKKNSPHMKRHESKVTAKRDRSLMIRANGFSVHAPIISAKSVVRTHVIYTAKH